MKKFKVTVYFKDELERRDFSFDILSTNIWYASNTLATELYNRYAITQEMIKRFSLESLDK